MRSTESTVFGASDDSKKGSAEDLAAQRAQAPITLSTRETLVQSLKREFDQFGYQDADMRGVNPENSVVESLSFHS